MSDNRTNEALLSRRALAEKATPGPWRTDDLGNIFRMPQAPQEEYIPVVLLTRDYDKYVPSKTNAAHIAANTPAVVMADIDEILRLRAEVERLEKEADWLAQAAANAGWSGVRVGPHYMRAAARKAVERTQSRNEKL